jgi:acetyl esterase/lipase
MNFHEFATLYDVVRRRGVTRDPPIRFYTEVLQICIVAAIPGLLALMGAIAPAGDFAAAELTPSELALKRLLGDGTPDPIPLWPGKPPRFVEDAPPEVVTDQARLKMVSLPTVSPYLSPKEKRTGMAVVVCAGGGYGGLDWRTHVVYAAQVFNPKGVAVIGLKYRTRPPHMVDNEGIQEITLLDAKRAVRFVRHRAAEWNLDPHKIGVVGYSAGANLAMNLAANFDAGDPKASDPIERQGSRPDFAVGLGTWHWRKKESPFEFSRNSPPVFLVHATTDVPLELPRQIKADLENLGVPVRLEMFAEGGHGVGNLIPTRVKHGFPPAHWPDLLLKWLGEISGP